MSRKTLGVIGGVGPLSTAYFMEVVINRTAAVTDQQHIDMIVLNHADIPDRTDYILDHTKPNPVLPMREDAQKLERWGADILVTPCNTAHYFYEELASAVGIPFLNMIEETAKELSALKAKRVGILATDGTIAAGLFQNALSEWGITPLVPSKQNQQYVMDIIYDDIKAANPLEREKFSAVTAEMEALGCDHLILGCTELSILKRDCRLDDYYLDALEVLADRAIEACGKQVKK